MISKCSRIIPEFLNGEAHGYRFAPYSISDGNLADGSPLALNIKTVGAFHKKIGPASIDDMNGRKLEIDKK